MQDAFVKNHIQHDIEVYYTLSPILILLLCNLSWADLPAFFPVETQYSQDTTEYHQPCTEGHMAASGLEKWGLFIPKLISRIQHNTCNLSDKRMKEDKLQFLFHSSSNCVVCPIVCLSHGLEQSDLVMIGLDATKEGKSSCTGKFQGISQTASPTLTACVFQEIHSGCCWSYLCMIPITKFNTGCELIRTSSLTTRRKYNLELCPN